MLGTGEVMTQKAKAFRLKESDRDKLDLTLAELRARIARGELSPADAKKINTLLGGGRLKAAQLFKPEIARFHDDSQFGMLRIGSCGEIYGVKNGEIWKRLPTKWVQIYRPKHKLTSRIIHFETIVKESVSKQELVWVEQLFTSGTPEVVVNFRLWNVSSGTYITRGHRIQLTDPDELDEFSEFTIVQDTDFYGYTCLALLEGYEDRSEEYHNDNFGFVQRVHLITQPSTHASHRFNHKIISCPEGEVLWWMGIYAGEAVVINPVKRQGKSMVGVFGLGSYGEETWKTVQGRVLATTVCGDKGTLKFLTRRPKGHTLWQFTRHDGWSSKACTQRIQSIDEENIVAWGGHIWAEIHNLGREQDRSTLVDVETGHVREVPGTSERLFTCRMGRGWLIGLDQLVYWPMEKREGHLDAPPSKDAELHIFPESESRAWSEVMPVGRNAAVALHYPDRDQDADNRLVLYTDKGEAIHLGTAPIESIQDLQYQDGQLVAFRRRMDVIQVFAWNIKRWLH